MITCTVKLTGALACLFFPFFLFSQSAQRMVSSGAATDSVSGKKSIFDDILRDAVPEVTLRTDLGGLLENRYSEDLQPATLTYEAPDGSEVSRPLELRLRGKYRRRVCPFPPLRLEFSEETLTNAGLHPKYGSLKLVTHCLDEKNAANDNVLREYLAYRLYNLLTENSYRVQLVQVIYVDEADGSTIRRYGFLLEDTDEMAHRLGGKECDDCLNPAPERVPAKEAALLAVYQYMIGNSDWNIPMLRNLKFVRRSGEGDNLLVPYDFDFAGLVNAPYARPNIDYGLKSIRDRVYLGFPVGDDELKWAFNYLKFKKEELLNLVDDFRLLRRTEREDIIAYLEHFFDFLSDLNVNSASGLYQRLSGEPFFYQADAGSGN